MRGRERWRGTGVRARAARLPLILLAYIALGVQAATERAWGDELGLALLPVRAMATPSSIIQVDVLATNRAASEAPFPFGEKVMATLSLGGRSWSVTLLRDSLEEAHAIVPPGGFVSTRYHVSLPPEAQGRAILTVENQGGEPLRAVIDIVGAGAAESAESFGARNEGFQRERVLSTRLSIYQPIYFIAGGNPPAKFQFSFKYRLASIGASDDPEPPHTLQVAFTQLSLWQIGPFYDTSYMPELMYQWLVSKTPREEESGITWHGLQAAYLHESNGRGGADERSANIFYVRPVFSVGSPDDWHVLFQPELWIYLATEHNTRTLYLYRGNSALKATVGKGNEASLTFTWLPGEHFSYGSRQLDLSIPVHIPLFDLSTYVLVQYFDGYAESLISYQSHTSALRAGLQFVR
jgi:outer membrane phospholipase A